MKITTKEINHLGIISGLFHEFELVEFIDELLPKTRDHNITHGQVILAMCLNGLGFSDTRLYLYTDYFKDLPTERLIGEGVLPEHLTDNVLERTLDKIFEYGCTELFNQIILHIMQKVPLGTNVLHADTTNFSLYGKYASVDPGFETIEITYGHAKDMRYDLKRFVLSMVCNQHGIPLFMEALSGNASDKKTLVESVKKIQDSLVLSDDVLHIADSAIYSDNNITKLGENTLWITRIPATINQVQDLLTADFDMNLCEDERY